MIFNTTNLFVWLSSIPPRVFPPPLCTQPPLPPTGQLGLMNGGQGKEMAVGMLLLFCAGIPAASNTRMRSHCGDHGWGLRLPSPAAQCLRGGGGGPRARAGDETGQQRRRRRKQWQEVMRARGARIGDSSDVGESDELSSEAELSADRPDAYVKPEPPVVTDFTDTGLPDFLDPIYDDAEEGELFTAEACGSGEGFNDDVEDIVENKRKGTLRVKWRRVPGLVHVEDHLKDLTFSELDEVETIWGFNDRNYGDLLPKGEVSTGTVFSACAEPLAPALVLRA